MKKILVPIDFTETSDNAFVHAIEMAKVLHAELVLLHTFDLPIIDNQLFPQNYIEVLNSAELAQFEYFKDKIRVLRELADNRKLGYIQMNHLLMDGDLIDAIKKAVKQENIDMVVMGTNGASGWTSVFIGTNTGYVISDISVPVLSVPIEAKFQKIETIAFTTRFREKDIEALIKVLKIAKKLHANVKCLYVKTSNSDVTDEKIKRWESHFEDEPIQFFVIPSEDVKETIEDFLVNQGADILAILTYKRNFFAELFTHTLTQKLSYYLKTPILAFH
jgi:nucleotide-binding universal stress UspA family protein